MATIPLGQQTNIVTQQAQSVQTDTITIQRLVILPQDKKVRVFAKEFARPILVLSGDAYDAYMATSAPTQILTDLTNNIKNQIAGGGLTFDA